MKLDRVPRHPLLLGPSPIQPFERLTDHLAGPRIWAKREDSTAGLINFVQRGEIHPDSNVLYAHLGGVPAISAYAGRVT
jgi:1-aminocyclopropane-1-carboxylate deaminase/D-cysteine desulfhydrase-like pyridoxal-dependent ACC family enzyme